jgi:hypothetical protein
MSKEIARDQNVMLLLGSMRADERLAVFLLSLAERYKQRGYSSTEFVLRMTREEIGSFLGLKLETVSRLFSRFQDEGLLQVQGRAVKLLDPVALKQVVGSGVRKPRLFTTRTAKDRSCTRTCWLQPMDRSCPARRSRTRYRLRRRSAPS